MATDRRTGAVVTAPSLDESRDGARVVVYGAASPVTDAEWYCARLVAACCDGLPLVIDTRPDYGVRASAGHAPQSMPSAVYETRPRAVAGLARMLAVEARGIIARELDKSMRVADEVTARLAEGRRAHARASELRDILAGAPADAEPEVPEAMPGTIAPEKPS